MMRGTERPSIKAGVWALAAIAVLLAASMPVRAEENAEFAGAGLRASPPVQGIGGVVTVRLTADFYGGCCYPLWAYDVVPVLSTPAGVEVLSGPSPADIGKFEAKQGGLLTPAVFTYTLRSMAEGKYALNASVGTRNCGSQTARMTLEYIKGAIFSDFRMLYPATVSVSEKSFLSVEAYSGLEGVTVVSVDMRYALLAAGTPERGLKSDDAGVLSPGGIKGTGVALSRDTENPVLWRGTVPPLGRTGLLAVWLLAIDSSGNTTVSTVFANRVVDTPGVYRAVMAAPISVMLVLVLGTVCIAVIWRRRYKEVPLPDSPALGIPGQRRVLESLEKKPSRARLALQAAALAVAAVLVVYSVTRGLFTLMTGYTGGG